MLALPLILAPWGIKAQEVRYHGFQMDQAHKLILEEEDGVVRVTIVWRARPVGDLPAPVRRQEAAASGRYTRRRELIRVASRVTKPAAPNYFSNPGAEYEVRVEGLAVAPEFRAKRRLPAANARPWLAEQFKRLRGQASDPVDRLALRHAEGAVMMLLHKAARFPPQIHETVKRSLVGRVRLEEDALERRDLPTDSPMIDRRAPGGPATRRTPELRRTDTGVTAAPPGQGKPLEVTPGPAVGPPGRKEPRTAPGAAAGVSY
jgi:hypothetical protein